MNLQVKRLPQTNKFLLLLLCFVAPLPGLAHGITTEQIKQLTEQINRAPLNAELYLRRGELYRLVGNAKGALEDYAQVEKLAPQMVEVDFYRARLYLDAATPEMAQLVLDRFLKQRPQHTEALLLRAKANAKLDERAAAIRDYTQAISQLAHPKPEYFLARAQIQIAGNQIAAALRGLDEGIAKLGPLVTLQLLAIELEIKGKRWDAGLARLDTLAAQSPRQERWLLQRSELLLLAGRKDEARQAVVEALAAMTGLPAHLHRTKAITALAAKAQELLQAINLQAGAAERKATK